MSTLSLTAEEQLILECMRCCLAPERELPALVKRDIDYQRLFSAAQVHRAMGALLEMEKRAPGFWPTELSRRILAYRLTFLVHAEQAVAQVASTLAELTRAGVPLVVLKGWDYIHTVYGGDYSLRPCSDIDILIRSQDVKAAEAALDSQGFEPYEELWPGIRFRYGNADTVIVPVFLKPRQKTNLQCCRYVWYSRASRSPNLPIRNSKMKSKSGVNLL